MEIYLLKSGFCLAIFFVFYKMFLERENMNTFKRFYLLGSLFAAIGIPLVTFTIYSETSSVFISSATEGLVSENLTILNYLPTILWSIYFIGILFFSIRFGRNLASIILKIKRNQKLKLKTFINVLLNEKVLPHTFFNYIFLNKQKFEEQKIPVEVLLHEQTHAIQKHSFDVLFIEILQIIFWFNPFIHLIKHAIKLNHEFLADKAVLNMGVTPAVYQNLLLAFSSNASENKLANAINYSLIKKRFTVMKTYTSKRNIRVRGLLLLPLFTLLLFSFSTKKTIYLKNKDNTIDLVEKIQDKATAKQVAEYNVLAKKYNSQPRNNRKILNSEVERLKYLYSKMSANQKANAEPFPSFPPPPEKVKELKKKQKTLMLQESKLENKNKLIKVRRIALIDKKNIEIEKIHLAKLEKVEVVRVKRIAERIKINLAKFEKVEVVRVKRIAERDKIKLIEIKKVEVARNAKINEVRIKRVEERKNILIKLQLENEKKAKQNQVNKKIKKDTI